MWVDGSRFQETQHLAGFDYRWTHIAWIFGLNYYQFCVRTYRTSHKLNYYQCFAVQTPFFSCVNRNAKIENWRRCCGAQIVLLHFRHRSVSVFYIPHISDAFSCTTLFTMENRSIAVIYSTCSNINFFYLMNTLLAYKPITLAYNSNQIFSVSSKEPQCIWWPHIWNSLHMTIQMFVRHPVKFW